MAETKHQVSRCHHASVKGSTAAKTEAHGAGWQDRWLFDALMDHLPDKIYFKDKNSRFVRINKAMAEGFGLKDPAEAVGKSDRDFFTEEHASLALQDEQRILETGLPLAGKEEKETWPDGRETWATTTKAPLFDGNGRVIGTCGISGDITRAKMSEKQCEVMNARMQQVEKAESLGVLASGIAHDFNNLLTAVLGSVSLAMALHAADDEEKKVLKSIEEAAIRATELSSLLLAYAGRGNVTMVPIDLSALVSETIRFMDPVVPKTISRRHNLAADLPRVMGDATQIRQVITNLIANAADAIGNKSGTISISTSVTHCDAAFLEQAALAKELSPGCYVCLEVSDTGCGIPPDVKDRIFDPFFTTKPTGKGLGLSIVHGVIRRLKGAIKVYSEVGKGTTFKVMLRASDGVSAATCSEKRQEAWRGSGTVLVCDDEELICRISSQMLIRLGFKVLSATSGQRALELFRENSHEIVVVLVDEAMPQMNGSEVLAQMRKIKPDVRAILCSGYPENDTMGRAAGKGFSGFLQKPFTVRLISEKMRSVLAS